MSLPRTGMLAEPRKPVAQHLSPIPSHLSPSPPHSHQGSGAAGRAGAAAWPRSWRPDTRGARAGPGPSLPARCPPRGERPALRRGPRRSDRLRRPHLSRGRQLSPHPASCVARHPGRHEQPPCQAPTRRAGWTGRRNSRWRGSAGRADQRHKTQAAGLKAADITRCSGFSAFICDLPFALCDLSLSPLTPPECSRRSPRRSSRP